MKNIDNNKLNKDILKGIDMGIELSKDEGIEFKIEECTNNGNSESIDAYREQIQNNSIAKDSKKIIEEYLKI